MKPAFCRASAKTYCKHCVKLKANQNSKSLHPVAVDVGLLLATDNLFVDDHRGGFDVIDEDARSAVQTGKRKIQ